MKSSLLFISLLLAAPTVLASAGHTSGSGWQADIDLSYRDENGPNMLGFIPSGSHQQKQGISLDHADLSYQAELPASISGRSISDQQIGRIALSYHSSDVELAEAWLENRWQSHQLRFTAGKFLPRIGFLNHRHQHAQTFVQAPLLNKVYWGDELKEAGIRLEWLPQFGQTQTRHSVNLLGGDHLNSNDNTLAALWQSEVSHTFSQFSISALVNGYYTQVADRGMFLFDLSSNTHVHTNSGYSEFFDGDILHLGAGIQLSYITALGDFSYQAEYTRRQEQGRLYNATTELADLKLNSYGQYHQLWWSSQKKQWQLGLRFDHLYSDVEVSNTSDNSLDDSRLNNNNATPKRLSVMANWLLARQQKLQLIYSNGPDWDAYPAQLEIHLLQSFRF